MELMSLIKTMLMPRVTPRILFSGFGFFLCCTRPAIWIRSGGSTQRILSPFCNLGHGEQNNLFLFIHEDQTTHLAYPILSTQLTRSYKYMEYHGIHWILEYTAEYTTCFLCLLSLGVPFSWVARCLPLDAHGSCQTSCSSFVPGSQLLLAQVANTPTRDTSQIKDYQWLPCVLCRQKKIAKETEPQRMERHNLRWLPKHPKLKKHSTIFQ